MLRLVDAEHSLAEGTGSGTHARDARGSRAETGGANRRLGQGLLRARRGGGKGRADAQDEEPPDDGQEVTIVWMPYNWGFQGLSTGPSVNHLTIDAVDPGAGTQETKACLVNVAKQPRRRRRVSRAQRRTS